ncbi:hypothetical protein G6F31_020232 [Rhizopus arrhizus]|nr:hypothetical protein G6F31_020232 [Rhizopus arrhizus]
MVDAPVERGEAQVQVAQRAAHGDVRQAVVDAHTVGVVAQALVHGIQAGVDLAVLALDPFRAALRLGTLVFLHDGHASVQEAIGDGFPAFHGGTVAARLRNQAGDGGQGVHVFDDDARIEQRTAVFHDEAGHFAQGVVPGSPAFSRP